MRISEWIHRLGGDIAHNRTLLFLCVVLAWTAISFIAIGILAAANRITTHWDRRRARRVAIREPGRALAADDDRRIWHEARPDPGARPHCRPRKPAQHELHGVTAAATRICRTAAEHDTCDGTG